jgi:hypothetical protein
MKGKTMGKKPFWKQCRDDALLIATNTAPLRLRRERDDREYQPYLKQGKPLIGNEPHYTAAQKFEKAKDKWGRPE